MTAQKRLPAAMLPKKNPKKPTGGIHSTSKDQFNTTEPLTTQPYEGGQHYTPTYASDGSRDVGNANYSPDIQTIPYRSGSFSNLLPAGNPTYHSYYDEFINSIPQSADEDSTDSVYSDLSGVNYAASSAHAGLSPWNTTFSASEISHENLGLPTSSYLTPQSSTHSNAMYSGRSSERSTALSERSEFALPPKFVSAPGGYLVEEPVPATTSVYRQDRESSTPPAEESFRFHCTLEAPSSVDRLTNETPTTYLNKAEAYTMFVSDTKPDTSAGNALRYRTWIHLAFNDDEQRSATLASWQTWQRRRPNTEQRSRRDSLHAIELIDTSPKTDKQISISVQITQERFDAFCINWFPKSRDVPMLGLSVRFNFLSTDFSDNKGVKGANVRLYATNEVITSSNKDGFTASFTEASYCLIKTFRRFGAERKRKADLSRAEKDIKRGKHSASRSPPIKHEPLTERSHSATFDTPSPLRKSDTTSSITTLDLPGYDEDDPNLNPITLEEHNITTSSAQSLEHMQHEDYELSTAGRWIKPKIYVDTPSGQDLSRGRPFEAMRPSTSPFQLHARAVACFFIRAIINGVQPRDDSYRAIYVADRTLEQFVAKTSEKCGVDPAQVTDVIRIGPRGMHITVDDGVIENLPEGQSLTAVFENIDSTTAAESHLQSGDALRSPTQKPKFRLVIWY